MTRLETIMLERAPLGAPEKHPCTLTRVCTTGVTASMIRPLRQAAAVAFAYAIIVGATGCTTLDDPGPVDAPPRQTTSSRTTPTPPKVEPPNVSDWPPFGAQSTIQLHCTDEFGLARATAHFKSVASRAQNNATRADETFTGAELGEGQGTLRLQCCDTADACTERQVTNFLVDLTPPAIEAERLIASPLIGGGDSLDGEITIWVRDAWVLGSVELSFNGKTLVHEFPKAYPATLGNDWDVSRVTFPAKDLPLGEGKATVIARDAAGNSAMRELDIRIDATPPTVSIQSPLPNASPTNDALFVSIVADDATNDVAPTIDLWVGGARIAELQGPSAQITVDTSTLPSGPTEVRAIARDNAGNESIVSKVTVQIP